MSVLSTLGVGAVDAPASIAGALAIGSSSSFGPSWLTPPSSAEVGPHGWAPLDNEWEIAHVVDPRFHLPNGEPIFARLTYAGALEVARREGASLISGAQVAELQQKGIQVGGVYLPDAVIRAAAAGPLARRPGEPLELWDQRLRNAGMTSLSWALHHDEVFWQRLGSWPAGALVAGAGKHWVAGAPAGRAWLMGWWDASTGKFIQGEPHPGDAGFHDDSHHDYGTTTVLVRRRDGSGGGGGSGGWIVAALALAAGAVVAGLYFTGAASSSSSRSSRRRARRNPPNKVFEDWAAQDGVPVTSGRCRSCDAPKVYLGFFRAGKPVYKCAECDDDGRPTETA